MNWKKGKNIFQRNCWKGRTDIRKWCGSYRGKCFNHQLE